MTLLEAIQQRHSVREYKNTPIANDAIVPLQVKIEEINAKGNLHAQLILNEPKAFKGIFAYGKFRNVTNYIVMAGPKGADLDEKVGYYGEQLVLLAQQLGLNTCWVGLSYTKIANTYTLYDGEKISCYIALGYGATQGISHKTKSLKEISNVSDSTPHWFRNGVESAQLAPTAINQQKFSFEYIDTDANGIHRVKANRGFSLVGYTKMDLGIAKCHFEIGAGKNNFQWA